MIIDASYFFGPLMIGQLDQPSVQDELNLFIDQYEPEYMEAVMGYETYRDFKAGLLEDPILQKWTDLLAGTEYTDINGRLQNWKGLIRNTGAISVSIIDSDGSQTDPPVGIVVGRGQDYDPVDDSTTTIIPPDLVGKNFTFQQRVYGPLRPDEYSVSGSTLTLLGGLTFNSGDTYFYLSPQVTYAGDSFVITTSGTGLIKRSPIANYVYWQYQKAQVTATSGTGESKPATQNAIPAGPGYKMMDAWNHMVKMNREMHSFMYSERETYTTWHDWTMYCNRDTGLFETVNMYGI